MEIEDASFFCRSLQISHARRAGKPSLLNDWAMLSGDDIGDLGESKGVVLWLLDRLSSCAAKYLDGIVSVLSREAVIVCVDEQRTAGAAA